MIETLVVDASIVVKWVIEEQGTAGAVALRRQFGFVAPDLLVAECANILWKKVQRGELEQEEALLAARLLQRADIELLPMRGIMETAAKLAMDLGHPAYDCIYLGLAWQKTLRFVTADDRLLRVVSEKAPKSLTALCSSLDQITKYPSSK